MCCVHLQQTEKARNIIHTGEVDYEKCAAVNTVDSIALISLGNRWAHSLLVRTSNFHVEGSGF